MVEADVERVARDGWAPLPAWDEATLTRLREAAEEIDAALGAQLARFGRRSSDLDQLLPDADLALRRRGNERLRAILGPVLARAFPRHRAVAFNVIVKRAGRDAVPLHRDFALVDERGGASALQVWAPLCDVDEASGALVVADGSHAEAPAIRCVGSTDEKKSAERTTTLRLRAGEGVVFSNRTVHASAPNRAAHDRRAVGAILVPLGVGLAHWIERSPTRRELWSLDDGDLIALSPDGMPASARLVDVVEVGIA